MDTTLDSPVQEQQQKEYAGFWLRFVAYVIDGLIIGTVYWLLVLPLLGALGFESYEALGRGNLSEEEILSMGTTLYSSVMILNLINIVGYWLYFALMESSGKQATLGKMVLGLIVTDMHGNRIGFAQATGRYFGKIISTITLLIGFIMAGFTEKKQALHDIIANTLVIKK